MSEKNYRDAVRINKYELGDLWEDHSDRFLDWWESYANAKQIRNLAEAKLDLLKKENKEEIEYIKADLEIDIRRNPHKYHLTKTTDQSVASCILTQSRYRRQLELARAKEKEAREELIEAEHNMDVLKGAAEAFDKRTDALKGLTQLMVGGLISAKVPNGPLKTEVEARRADENRRELNAHMRERKED